LFVANLINKLYFYLGVPLKLVLDQLAEALLTRESIHEHPESAPHSHCVGGYLNPVQLGAIRALVVDRHIKIGGVAQLTQAVVVAILKCLTSEVVKLALLKKAAVEVCNVDHAAARLITSHPSTTAAHLHIDRAEEGHVTILTDGGERRNPLDRSKVSYGSTNSKL